MIVRLFFWNGMKKTLEMFDAWNEMKKKIEFWKLWDKSLNVGEFWWYREWINIGNEISKDWFYQRPCIVLQNNFWNWLYLIAPITTKYHKWLKKRYISVFNPQKYNLQQCRIVINQIKLIDKKRFFCKTNNHTRNESFIKIISNQYKKIIN